MLPIRLIYGNESFEEISNFMKKNYHEGYTLSIYNNLDQSTIEVICDFDSMVDVIIYVANVEHDFPAWIGVNELSDSYVVGMDFTRGILNTQSEYKWKAGKLIKK